MTPQPDPLFQIFSEVFNVPLDSLNNASSQDTISEWDSFGMVSIINEIEKKFNVEFDLLEIADFKNIGIIRSILIEKGVTI
jgi:acyl carrier protein